MKNEKEGWGYIFSDSLFEMWHFDYMIFFSSKKLKSLVYSWDVNVHAAATALCSLRLFRKSTEERAVFS